MCWLMMHPTSFDWVNIYPVSNSTSRGLQQCDPAAPRCRRRPAGRRPAADGGVACGGARRLRAAVRRRVAASRLRAPVRPHGRFAGHDHLCLRQASDSPMMRHTCSLRTSQCKRCSSTSVAFSDQTAFLARDARRDKLGQDCRTKYMATADATSANIPLCASRARQRCLAAPCRLLCEGSHAHLLDLPADFSGALLRWARLIPD